LTEPRIHAQVCDLLGEDPDAPAPSRPAVEQARARCRPGQVMACRRGDRALVLVTLADGRSFTAPDRCPHDGGLLSDGFVDGDRLVCARHGWEFELESGTCPGRPRVRLDTRRE
jgi:nitrite reductase/ring-hydroxylating ferredoxin subunit